MDSIADTLWTLFSLAVIIGSLVFGTVRKGKKAAQQAPHKEAWPKIEIKPIVPADCTWSDNARPAKSGRTNIRP